MFVFKELSIRHDAIGQRYSRGIKKFKIVVTKSLSGLSII